MKHDYINYIYIYTYTYKKGMIHNDSGNSSTGSLLEYNIESHDHVIKSDAFSRHVLTHIKALREALAGKGDEYTKLEMTRLLRELTLIANLITIKSGKPLCMEML